MMRIVRREPFRDFVTLREAIGQLAEGNLRWAAPPWVEREDHERRLRLPLDVYMTPEEVVILAPVPGLEAEDVEITLEGDTLTIKGEVKLPMDNVDYILRERPHGQFSRTLTFNIPIQADKAEATFENGLLTLAVPKAEAIKAKTIKVRTA